MNSCKTKKNESTDYLLEYYYFENFQKPIAPCVEFSEIDRCICRISYNRSLHTWNFLKPSA